MDRASRDLACVSVVVPVHDGAASLPSLLDALAAQQGAPRFEVIVVDNASRDATPSIARTHRVVTNLVTESRRGSYRARNAGLAVTTGEIVAFTDADCLPDPGWLAAGVAALEDADLAGGAIDQARSPQPTIWEIYDRATYLDQEELVANQHFAATANLFVRRRVFDVVGQFDGRLSSSGDFEFGRRAVAAGFHLVYADRARVSHQPRRTLGGLWRLNQRLGEGWATLAWLGGRPPVWRDRAMWIPLDWVAHSVASAGESLRRRRLVLVHTVVMSARWFGRLRGWVRVHRRRDLAPVTAR